MKKPWEEDYGLSNEIKPWELDYSKPIETSSQQQEPPKIEQPSGLEAFLNKGKIPTREEKRAIELAPPGVLGDTSYGHALYGSIKTGLAGLLGTKDGELTPGALRVLEEGRKEDIYPTMGDVIDAYNQEGFLPAAQKFAEATPYTLVRTAPQIAAGAAASVLAPELAIGAGLTRLGLGPAAEFAGGMIPRAIATYPTQVPFNYSGNILEQQQARESQAAKGETPTPISPERALEGAAAQSVIDALIAGRFTGGVSKLSPAELLAKAGERGTFKEAAARVGKSALEAGLENIIAEPVQEVIARAQANEELTSPEAIRAYEEAALSGAPMAAAGVPKGLLEVSAPEKARQQLSSAAERADEILNPSIGTTPPPLSQDEFKAYGELMAHAKHAQTLGIEGFEKTPDEFYKELESRVGVEPEQLHDMSLQKPSEQAQEVGTEQPAPIEQSQQIAPSGVSFTTAKGSTYQVNDNGTTTRNKSYHPEHGVEDQGEQPTSHQTVYVDRSGLNKLGMFQSVAPDGLVHQLVTDNGMAAIRRVDATTGQASPEYRQSVTQVHSEPAVGLYPVEIWDNGGTVHFGNKITNVETPQVESYWNKYTHPITNKPYSDMSIDELHTLKDNANELNNHLDREAIVKHFGVEQANAYEKMNRRERNKWWDDNATEEFEKDSSVFKGIDEDSIDSYINATSLIEDAQSPQELGQYLGGKIKGMSSANYSNSPEYYAVKEGLKLAKEKGWSESDVINSMKSYAVNYAGNDAPELFPTLFPSLQKEVPAQPTRIQKQTATPVQEQATAGKKFSKSIEGGAKDVIVVNGVERPTTNSNGQPIHPTEEGVRNFWKWFGDSKVVDDQGRPLVVYHGSPLDFDKFNQNSWFTTDPEDAKTYANMEVPGAINAPAIYPVYLKIVKPKYVDWYILKSDANASLDKLKKDSGFVISQLGRKHFVVKNPPQIKSATGNQGTFNPEEADIRKSETAAPVENPHTAESLQEALAKRYGNNAPKINLGSLADVGNDTLVQGYYHPDTGVTLIPEDIDQSKDLHGLIRHEVAVHAQRLGKTDQEFQAILTQLQALRDKGAKAIQEAYARVPKDTAPDLVHEEALGYLVEYAKQLPIVQRFMSWLRRTAYKLTGSAKWLKENDFAKMADEVLKKQPVKNVGKEAAYSKRNDNWSTEEVDSLRQKIDKISDKAKEVVLKAPSIAGIYDIATDKLLPGGKKIIEQLRIMNAEQRHNVTKAADKIKQLHEWMAKDFTKKHILDEVTSEATLLGARPDNAAFMQNLIDGIAVNKPEGYQETLARLSKLQSDWSRLGKSGQSMYKMMRDSYQDTLAEMYDAMKDNVRKLTSLSNEEKESRIRDLDEQLSSIKLKGDYFPILRYGNWGVTYKENNETKYTKFETERQAKEFVKKLEDAGEEGYLIKDTDEIRNVLGVDTADFNKLYTDVKTLGEEGAPDVSEIKDLLFQTYLMSRPERSISKRFMHRKGTAGYSNDAIRAFAKHSLSMANQVPRIKHGREVLDGVRSMKHRLPKSGKENALSQYYYEAFKREAENVINPVPTDPIAGFLTQFGFDAYLTSVASAVNQMASVPALALPAIAKKHGLINAQSALNTATQWYVESGANKKDGWWNIARGIDKTKNVSKVVKGAKYANDFDPKDAYQQFLDNGIIDSTLYMQAFEAGSKPTGAHEDVLDRAKRIMNIVAIPFGQMESASRQIASMGAYIAGMKSGMHHQQAVEYAINLIYRDMGDYGPTGRSKLSKSTLGRIGYQFQQYSSKLFHSIGMSVRDIFSNNPEERTIAIKHLGGLYAMHYLLAGALGLPGAGLVGSIVDEIEDLLDEDEWHSYEANLKSWLNKKLPDNEVIQNIILEGPLATALGVDLKSRLGAQDILPLFRESEMNDGIVKKSAEKLGQMASGIPSVGAIGAALDHYEAERYGKALTGLIPNAQIKSIASAYRYATEGKVTPKGGEVISPKEITKADVAKRAIGYEPLTTSQKSTAAREQGAENRFLSTRKSKIQEQLVESIVKDDKAAKDKALKMIEKFSNKNPSYAFDSDEITSAVRNRYKYLQTNLRGQNVPLKQMQYYLDKVPHLRK